MKHWFYDEQGLEKQASSYSVEQQKQFLDELCICYLKIGRVVEHKITLGEDFDSLEDLLALLKAKNMSPKDVRLHAERTKKEGRKKNVVSVYFSTGATEEDVRSSVGETFVTAFDNAKWQYKHLEWWSERLGYKLVKREE